jgi:hypothetical protein
MRLQRLRRQGRYEGEGGVLLLSLKKHFILIVVLSKTAGFLTPIGGAVVLNIGSILVVLSSASLGQMNCRPDLT